jgi:hypothetical protein
VLELLGWRWEVGCSQVSAEIRIERFLNPVSLFKAGTFPHTPKRMMGVKKRAGKIHNFATAPGIYWRPAPRTKGKYKSHT